MAEHAKVTSYDTDVEVQHTHHIVPVKTYYIIFAWLMVLLVLTLVAAMFDLGPLNVVVAMAIATAKALLVVLYFMHVRYSSRLVQVFAGAALIWLLIMFVITFGDYLTRGWVPLQQGSLTP